MIGRGKRMSSSPLVVVMIMASIVVLFQGDVAQGRGNVPYIVGGTNGWSPNVSYSDWVKGKTFKVGDTLVFNYQYPNLHGVCTVDKSGYDNCNRNDKCRNSGSDHIWLGKTGVHYFTCSSPRFCMSGMKFTINVSKS